MKTTERFDVQYYKSKIKEVMVKMETTALPFMWIEIVHRLRCI